MKKNASILLVEDEADIRDICRGILSPIVSHIEEATDGLNALECLKQNQVDVVLSDIQMPNIDGLALLKATRKLGNDVPFVMLTSNGTRENILLSLRLGAIEFLEKPIERTTLITAVIKALALTPELSGSLTEEAAPVLAPNSSQNIRNSLRAHQIFKQIIETEKRLAHDTSSTSHLRLLKQRFLNEAQFFYRQYRLAHSAQAFKTDAANLLEKAFLFVHSVASIGESLDLTPMVDFSADLLSLLNYLIGHHAGLIGQNIGVIGEGEPATSPKTPEASLLNLVDRSIDAIAGFIKIGDAELHQEAHWTSLHNEVLECLDAEKIKSYDSVIKAILNE